MNVIRSDGIPPCLNSFQRYFCNKGIRESSVCAVRLFPDQGGECAVVLPGGGKKTLRNQFTAGVSGEKGIDLQPVFFRFNTAGGIQQMTARTDKPDLCRAVQSWLSSV